MNSKITLSQKRFLIIWISIHSFALFVNLFGIGKDVLTSSGHKSDFWPFTEFTYRDKTFVADYNDPRNNLGMTYGKWETGLTQLNGIFTGYDFSEYIFYMILGLGIVFVPRFWNN